MQYFPALEELAEKRHWRLITLTKAECTPGEVQIRSMVADREYSQCDAWREDALQRIEAGDPRTAIVVMSGDTAYTPYGSDGEELSGDAGAAAMEAGYIATLKRIHRAGLRTVVIRDTPVSASDVPGCVSEDLEHLDSCAFPRVRDRTKEFDVARRPRGAGNQPDRHHPRDLPRRPLPRGDRQRPRLPRQEPPHRHLRPHPRPRDRARPEEGRPGLSRHKDDSKYLVSARQNETCCLLRCHHGGDARELDRRATRRLPDGRQPSVRRGQGRHRSGASTRSTSASTKRFDKVDVELHRINDRLDTTSRAIIYGALTLSGSMVAGFVAMTAPDRHPAVATAFSVSQTRSRNSASSSSSRPGVSRHSRIELASIRRRVLAALRRACRSR